MKLELPGYVRLSPTATDAPGERARSVFAATSIEDWAAGPPHPVGA